MWTWLKQLFCRHKWDTIKTLDFTRHCLRCGRTEEYQGAALGWKVKK